MLTKEQEQKVNEAEEEEMWRVLDSLKEREKNSIMRKIKNRKIRWDGERKKLVHCGKDKDFELGDIDEDSDEDMDSGSDKDSDKDEPE